jgi:hypothetical protein
MCSSLVRMSASCDVVETLISFISPFRITDQLHLSVSNHFMSKVLVHVNVSGWFPSGDDVVAPLNARYVVLLHWCGRLLSKAKSF